MLLEINNNNVFGLGPGKLRYIMKRTNLEMLKDEIMSTVKEIEWVYDQLDYKIIQLRTVNDRLISVRKLYDGITISTMGLTVKERTVEFDGELVFDRDTIKVNEDALRAILRVLNTAMQLMEIEMAASNRSLSSSILDVLS